MTQIIAVVGPTASGKTALAIELAEALDTEIVSADSMQFYRGMEIGTGAPTPDELARVKHHFVGFLDPSDEISAGEYQVEARPVVEAINARGKPAVLVGGSGLYINALVDGLFDGPGKDQDIRDRLEDEAERNGVESLYKRLESIDPEYAAVISENDLRRVVRALEVHAISGVPMTQLHRERPANGDALSATFVAIDFPRDELYARIDARVDRMLEIGLLDEIQRLIDGGYGPDIDRLKSLGYRELAGHLRGECDLAEAVELMKMYSRRYAKRQLTWFRGDTRIHWIAANIIDTPTFHAKQLLETIG